MLGFAHNSDISLVAEALAPLHRRSMGYNDENKAAIQRARLAACVLAVADHQDRDAFGELFDYFAPRLRAYLRRLLVSEGQLDDLIQDVMLSVWRKAGQYDPERANVSTWVFTIARNRRIDIVRRERRPEPDPEDPAFTPGPDPRPDEVVDQADAAARVKMALGSLPDEQAQVMTMSFFQDKSHSEIAEELGLPLGTVKSRMRLGLQRLRTHLEGSQ